MHIEPEIGGASSRDSAPRKNPGCARRKKKWESSGAPSKPNPAALSALSSSDNCPACDQSHAEHEWHAGEFSCIYLRRPPLKEVVKEVRGPRGPRGRFFFQILGKAFIGCYLEFRDVRDILHHREGLDMFGDTGLSTCSVTRRWKSKYVHTPAFDMSWHFTSYHYRKKLAPRETSNNVEPLLHKPLFKDHGKTLSQKEKNSRRDRFARPFATPHVQGKPLRVSLIRTCTRSFGRNSVRNDKEILPGRLQHPQAPQDLLVTSRLKAGDSLMPQ